MREWFRSPIDDRRDEAFQVVIGADRQPYLSFSRIFHRPADGAFIQSWVTFDHWPTGAGEQGWPQQCWYGNDFPDQDEMFAALEATCEFRRASELGPWHVKVSWQRTGEGADVATVMRDMQRSLLS